MKRFTVQPAFVILILGALIVGSYSVIAGPLDPPFGPVESTGTTLKDIEPRVVIHVTDIPLVIDEPGSYVLVDNLRATADLPHAIEITSSNVTLDMGGFTIMPRGGLFPVFYEVGVKVTGDLDSVIVRNGTITGCSINGINASNEASVTVQNVHSNANDANGIRLGNNARVIDCTANGNSGIGFFVGDGSVITGCIANNNAQRGIRAGEDAVIERCSATDNVDYGIQVGEGASVHRCTASGTGGSPGYGFSIATYSTVTSCTSTGNTADGFNAVAAIASVFETCTSSENGGSGFFLTNGCAARACVARENGNTGITAGQQCNIESCVADFNGSHGIDTGTSSIITGCRATANGATVALADGFSVGANNTVVSCSSSNSADKGFSAIGDASMFRDCTAYLNVNEGFFTSSAGVNIQGCVASENGGDGFHLTSTADSSILIGNQARSNDGAGFLLATGVTGCRIGQNHTTDDEYNLGFSLNFTGEIQSVVDPMNALSDDPWVNTDN